MSYAFIDMCGTVLIMYPFFFALDLSATVHMNVEHDEVNLGLDILELDFVVDPPHISGLCRVLYTSVYDQK